MSSKQVARPSNGDKTSDSRSKPSSDRDRDGNADSWYARSVQAPAGAGSILKALRILEMIVDTAKPMSVAELSTVLNYSKPTTHRIATFLEEFGFLEREPNGRRFVESQRLVDLSLNVMLASTQRPNRHGI